MCEDRLPFELVEKLDFETFVWSDSEADQPHTKLLGIHDVSDT